MASRIHNIHASTTFDWVINDFSKVNPEEGLYSDVFSVGGFEWQIKIRPKGYGELHKYLTVFLCPVDRTKFPFVAFSVSILNLINHYESASEGFKHKFNKDSVYGWGLPLMPVSELHEPGKGYVVHDACVLRVELSCRPIDGDDVREDMIESNLEKVIQLSEYPGAGQPFGEGQHNSEVCIGEDKQEFYASATFDWVVNGFSKVNSEEGIYSDIFSVAGIEWQLHINSKAVYSKVNEYLSVCLLPVDLTKDLFADFSISILNLLDHSESERQGFKHKFNKDSVSDWGLPVMPLSELHEPGKGYIVHNTCVLRVEVSCITIDDDVREDMNESRTKVMQSGEYPGAGQPFGEGQNSSKVGFGEDKQEFEDIGGFHVLKTQAPLYRQIWLYYGHIPSTRVVPISSYPILVMAVKDLMSAITDMYSCQHVDLLSYEMIQSCDDMIKKAERFEFNIRWLREEFEDFIKAFCGMQNVKTEVREKISRLLSKPDMVETDQELGEDLQLDGKLHEMCIK